jgi:hypothetical protein
MAVNLHRMLHGNFNEFLFSVGGYCDRAFALRRDFSAIDIFPAHGGCLLLLQDAQKNIACSAIAISSVGMAVLATPVYAALPLAKLLQWHLSLGEAANFSADLVGSGVDFYSI